MSLKHRSYEKELLDGDNIPFADILQNMKELNTVNTLLGGHTISRKGITYLLSKHKALSNPVHIAEIGCGGGDNLAAIHKSLHNRNIPHHFIGIDIKQQCIDTARQQYNDLPATWMCSDYRTVQWPGDRKPDIIFSSLFCHHFTDEELVQQLQWMKHNTNIGFFINDLHRHPLAYYAIKCLTRIFSRSYLVKHDAPLSVKRALIKIEWQHLLRAAKIYHYTISDEWAFRYLICAIND